MQTPNGTPSRALVVADVAHLVWAVNLGCLGFHVWPYRADDPDHADELRIDLDPSPGVTFAMVREAADETRAAARGARHDRRPQDDRPKRHPRVRAARAPVQDSFVVRAAAVALARELERRRPDLITAAWWKEERGTRVFVRLQPERAPQDRDRGLVGAAAGRRAGVDAVRVGRARRRSCPTSSPSPPCPDRVAANGDPWEAMVGAPQSLEPLIELHERDMAAGLMDAPWPPVYPKMPNEPDRVAPSRARKT